MAIQGILEIDKQKMTEEQFSEFQQFTGSFFIDFSKIGINDSRELYSCICRDKARLFDIKDEEDNVVIGALTIMGKRNPVLLGLWNSNGLLCGTEKVKVSEDIVDKDGNVTKEAEWEIQGTPEYSFNSKEYIKFMPDIVVYDEEGVELSRTRPTKAKQLHKYSGYGDLILE